MAREIKFRALDYKHKWQFGTYYYGCMYPTSFLGHYVNDEQIDENTLGQFTGLKDSNGAEIYEGDILMYLATNQSSMEVIFKDGCFYGEGPFTTHPLITYFTSLDFQSIEVTGNIYENTESAS